LTTRRELTAAIRQRYQAADRVGKKMILDEFTQVTGYHRKHAIRVLTTQPASEPKTRAVRRVYQEAVKEALIVLWEASDRICGKRLKALLPLLVEAMERHGHLQLEEGVRTQLFAMSASTIDRQLHPVREQACGGRKKKSHATNRVRKMVAVRTFADWEEQIRPGYLEVDLLHLNYA
jgi:sigma54-dependent transcription regulator